MANDRTKESKTFVHGELSMRDLCFSKDDTPKSSCRSQSRDGHVRTQMEWSGHLARKISLMVGNDGSVVVALHEKDKDARFLLFGDIRTL